MAEKIAVPIWIFAIPGFLALLVIGAMNNFFGLTSFEYGGLSGILSLVIVKIIENFKAHGSITAKG